MVVLHATRMGYTIARTYYVDGRKINIKSLPTAIFCFNYRAFWSQIHYSLMSYWLMVCVHHVSYRSPAAICSNRTWFCSWWVWHQRYYWKVAVVSSIHVFVLCIHTLFHSLLYIIMQMIIIMWHNIHSMSSLFTVAGSRLEMEHMLYGHLLLQCWPSYWYDV